VVIELSVIPLDAWRAGRSDRLADRYRPFSSSPDWPRDMAAWRRRWEDEQLDDGAVFAVEADGNPVGQVALTSAGPQATLHELWIAPEHQRRGYGRAALALVEEWARAVSPALGASVDPADPAHAALFHRYEPRAQNMVKQVSTVEDPGIVARPMRPDEYAAWREEEFTAFAHDISNAFLHDLPRALERSEREFDEIMPDGLATENVSTLCLDTAEGRVATIWLVHHFMVDTTWVSSITVDAAHRGQGHGRAAMLVGEQAAVRAGDGHIGLNVFATNPVAQHLYERLGYRTFSQTRTRDLR
jgi:GNAT superfamily N-acetyltransferase